MALMTVADYAEHVGVCAATVHNWTDKGLIPVIEIGAKSKVRFIDSETPRPLTRMRTMGLADPYGVGLDIERADVDALRARYGSAAAGVRAAVNALLRGSEDAR